MEFASSAATETGKYLLPKMKKHICFLYNYKENVESLTVARDNLDAKRTDGSRFADQNDRKFQDIGSCAVRWGSRADQLHQKAEKIISGNNISRLKPWSRYSSSKHACELTLEINEMVKNAPDFGAAFDRPAPELGAIFNLRGSMEFESRFTVLNEVYEALKDEEVSMCSVCGMGGIGKTTLVKKLIQRVEADHLFDKVAMVTVSQNPNFEKIQASIIEQLGLKIYETDITARGKKLNAWLTSNRTLLVLDDVWWQLNDEDFENVGIPLASKGCKIVVTSRNEDECNKMGSQPNFLINVLEDGEAWDLFRQNAGKCVEDLNLQEMARKIADECDGLPIAIVTIATALKDKPKAIWNDSLLQLQKSNLLGISGMEKVYSRIQLSYDLLQDKEAQSCFRLCCLFPEDYDVSVERLVFYGKGLELFENVDTMTEARDRVEMIIHKLKKSFLLLDGKEDGYIKMHDIARDFAISVSSKDKHPYLVRCEHENTKWPETRQCENCIAISLVCFTIREHLIDLRCPKLKLLQLNFKDDSSLLPVDLFEGMKELRVVDLRIPSALQPLTALKKLRTLLINYGEYYWNEKQPPTNIGDLLGDLGDLKNLEIFSYSIKMEVDDFPVEIGLLCNLRCLRFQNVSFKYMPQGVLSKLVKLEELGLSQKFFGWGCREEEGERVNASLTEIESLPLTTLSISVPKASILAENLVKSITRFQVYIGMDYISGSFHPKSDAELMVYEADACDVSWMSCLLRKCKDLRLMKVRNLKNIMSLESEEDNGFPQLKSLEIVECNEMEYLVNTTVEQIPSAFLAQLQMLKLLFLPRLKELWHGPCFSNIPASSFNVLSEIRIVICPKLKYVFPLSMAREMRQLQQMVIFNCDKMEEIIYNDQVDDKDQVAPSVQLNAPTVETTPTPTLDPIDHKPQHICPTPNSFIRGLLGKRRQPKDISSHKMMEDNIVKIYEREVDGNLTLFPALKLLSISGMNNLAEWSSPSDVIKVVCPCLQNLSIQFCPKLTGFPMSNLSELVELDIRDCEEFMLLPNKQQSFGSLTSLSIVGCPKLIDLQTWRLSKMSFNELSVRRCEWLTFIPTDLRKFSFLTSLEIYFCKRLRYFSEEILCKLTQLQNLSIGAFSEELDNFHYLNRIKDHLGLKELEIWGSDFFGREMGFLPNQLQHLTDLKSLKIIGFTKMEALPEWFVNLQSLRSLSLDYCRYLECQSTATIIQCLPYLTHLNVNCCPILEERKPELLQSLETTKIKVEFSSVSRVRVRLGY